MADELRAEPRTQGGIMRLLGREGGGRAALTAFAVGLAGTVAFLASLMVDWTQLDLPDTGDFGLGVSFAVGVDATNFAVGYLVGMLGLLTMLGLALSRAEFARRARLGAAALGIGLVGVLVAIIDQTRDVINQYFGYRFTYRSPIPPEIQNVLDGTTYAPLPGQFLGFGAVALLVAAIWLSGGPVRSDGGLVTPVTAAPEHADAGDPSAASPASASEDAAPPPAGVPGLPLNGPARGASVPPTRVGYVDGLTVSSSDLIDPGSQADILRS